jgi:hypothetical protein
MGVAYIAWIYDDSIQDAAASPDLWARRKEEVGEALLTLCLKPKIRYNDRTMREEKVTFHSIGHSGNGANLSDEVHSTDEMLFLWRGNSLRPFPQFSDDDLERATALITTERERRKRVPHL